MVPFQRGWLGHERRDSPYTRPEHVRLALEELGTTFVKLGQIVSTRGSAARRQATADFEKHEQQTDQMLARGD